MTDATKDYLIKKYGTEIITIKISPDYQSAIGLVGFQSKENEGMKNNLSNTID